MDWFRVLIYDYYLEDTKYYSSEIITRPMNFSASNNELTAWVYVRKKAKTSEGSEVLFIPSRLGAYNPYRDNKRQ